MQNFSLHVDGQCLKSSLVLLKFYDVKSKYIYWISKGNRDKYVWFWYVLHIGGYVMEIVLLVIAGLILAGIGFWIMAKFYKKL